MDLLDRIDELTASSGECSRCGRALGEQAVSDDFCSEQCQTAWNAVRAVPLPAASPFDLHRYNIAAQQAPVDHCIRTGHVLRVVHLTGQPFQLACEACDANHDELVDDMAAAGVGIYDENSDELIGVRMDQTPVRSHRPAMVLDGRGRVISTYR